MEQKKWKSYKRLSRLDWGDKLGKNEYLTDSQIQLGCILRIAEAVELMANEYKTLVDERNYYKSSYERADKKYWVAMRRISALRGVITKMRKRVK